MRFGKRSALKLLTILVLSLLMVSGCSSSQSQSPEATAVSTATATVTATVKATATVATTPLVTPTEKTHAAEPADKSTETLPSISPTSPITKPTPTPLSINTPDPTEDVEPNQGMFDPWFEAYTSIAYSSGTDSEWAYGNQRKEFTSSKPCYVRVSSSVVAPWHWGYVYGLGNNITVTYRITGAQNCSISVSDGFLKQVETDDPDIIEFTREIEAKSAKEDDNIVVFQYTPNGVGSVTIEVVYDHQVNSKYDARNTIYFIESEDW